MAPLLFSICNESEIHGVFLCTFLERGPRKGNEAQKEERFISKDGLNIQY